MKTRYIGAFMLLWLVFTSCRKDAVAPEMPGGTPAATKLSIQTDQARYSPGQEVVFTLSQSAAAGAMVRYKHLNNVVGEAALNGNSWQWTPPADDFKGYMAEVYQQVDGQEQILASIGIDVSSSWTRFPRYGFLSKFPDMNEQSVQEVIDRLNRYHINGLQFYDWHYKHHQPLAGTPQNPVPVYQDIINRDIHFATVKKYIDAAHSRNMEAMQYNLIFGALDDAAQAGVAEEWYLFKDANRGSKDKHLLPQPPFISDIFLLNPANTAWQQYLAGENRKVYEALPFDGFHMDQLGNRNTSLYTWEGASIDLAATYQPLIEAVKEAAPDKYHVMNAVSQYGQQGIAQAPTDFLYTEVWSPYDGFADLANIIKDNNAYSSNTKNTVLAAYMNYDLADNRGYFNTPAVLLTDAVIFAFGGAHLELGEHMLGKEYFPNSNLSMKEDLKKALTNYYDFMVAYQNLLRDGGTFNSPVISNFGQISLNQWPPQQGQVSVVGKKVGNRQVIHLLNFTNATTLNWRDNAGTQAYPQAIKDVGLNLTADGQVRKLWFASPDINGGASTELPFTQTGNGVTFTLPSLQFWDMVVVEY
jgi:dextranase